MSKTSNASKLKYNSKAYDTHSFKIRKDDPIAKEISVIKETQGLSALIRQLLEKHIGGNNHVQ